MINFLIKMVHVAIAVLLFIAMGSAYNSYQSKLETADFENINEMSTTEENHTETSTGSHENTLLEDASPITSSELVESILSDNKEIDQNLNPYLFPDLSYTMVPIKDHDIKHVINMFDIIEAFNKDPHENMDTLMNLLQTKNFHHIKEELSTKNLPVYNALVSLIESLDAIDLSITPNDASLILESLYTILDQLTQVK